MSQLALFMEKLSDQTSTLITSLTELILFFVVLTHWFTCAWFLVQVYPINFQVQSEAHPAKHLTLHDSWLANNGETDPGSNSDRKWVHGLHSGESDFFAGGAL